MDNEQAFPVIRQTVLDTTDPRRLAEFGRGSGGGAPRTQFLTGQVTFLKNAKERMNILAASRDVL